MQRKLLLVFVCATALTLLPLPAARAQETATAPNESEVPEANYRLKKITLSLFGGRFTGGTFLDLPALGPRTEIAEGDAPVYSYVTGEPFTTLDYRFYSAPRKRIEPGQQFGGVIGFYLSEEFHLDLQFSIASSKATTSFLFDNPQTAAADPERVQVEEDPSFKTLTGGGGLAYDARTLKIVGLTPYVGCAFGALINRFSRLEDKSALFFQVSTGFYRDLSETLRLSAGFSATTFSFTREELNYGKQVTYGTVALGLSYMIDMIPRD